MPESYRRPEKWPKQFRDTISRATRNEVCIPFESEDAIRRFLASLGAYRQSIRQYGGDRNILLVIGTLFDTIDVVAQRGDYAVNCTSYPLTLTLKKETNPFEDNLSQASVSDPKKARQPAYDYEYIAEESMKEEVDEEEPAELEPLSIMDILSNDDDGFGM